MSKDYIFKDKYLESILASLSELDRQNPYRFLVTAPDAGKMLSSLISPRIISCSDCVYLNCYDVATKDWCARWASKRISSGLNIRINNGDSMEYFHVGYSKSVNVNALMLELRRDLFVQFGV